MKKFKLMAIILVVLSIVSCVFPLSASAASIRTATVRNTGNFSVATADANLTATKYSLTNDFVVKKGSLVKLTTGVSANIFGIKYSEILIGGDYRYGRAASFNKASSTATATLYRTTCSTALRTQPSTSAKSIQSLPAGTILNVVGSVYNTKQKLNFLTVIATYGNSDSLFYIKASDATNNYSSSGNISLVLTQYTQTTNTSCSGASIKCLLLYNRLTSGGTDVNLKTASGACVGGIVKVLNKYLGSNSYRYDTYKTQASYEAAIRSALANGKPVILRVKIPSNSYLKYTSGGHYFVCYGIRDGKLLIADPYNVKVGGVRCPSIPISTVYCWGKYGGACNPYVIH